MDPSASPDSPGGGRPGGEAAPGALDPETLSRLAGGLAHELKNPLSTLGLHLSLLREAWEGEEDPRARRTVKSLDVLRQEVARLNEILEDFLRFARTDRIEPEIVSLNGILEGVLEFLEPEARARGVVLERFLDHELPSLRLDPSRIRQVFLNLVVNARQALEGQGGGRITVISRREGDEAVVEVLDDGPGMDPATLERAFEVYFSTKAGGTGLGLPTVRRLVEAHGGSLDLQSSPGHGTRAVVRLPIPEPEEGGV